MLFYDIPEYQIPVLHLTAPLELELAENATAKGMEVQTEKDKSGTHIQFHQASDLDPGTYYIRIVVTVLGDWVGDQQESTTYLSGFKLIVPESAVPTYTTVPATTRGPAV